MNLIDHAYINMEYKDLIRNESYTSEKTWEN